MSRALGEWNPISKFNASVPDYQTGAAWIVALARVGLSLSEFDAADGLAHVLSISSGDMFVAPL